MNKAGLIEAISAKIGLAKKEVEDTIDTMLHIVTERMKAGDEVTLTGFGAFSARTRKGRIGVNPRNPSEQIEIPSVTVPKFKAGKNLKEALKGRASAPAPVAAPAAPVPPSPVPTEPAAPSEPAM